MELIFSIFQAYSTARDVAQFYGHVSDWVIEKVNRWSRTASTKTIEIQVEKIAKLTEADIRRVAKRAVDESGSAVPAESYEELIGILLNMSRNVRMRSSAGSMHWSLLRGEGTLDRLLKNIEPIRHAGEKVAPGSPWVLRRHLGMGSFGEVWMAENPGYPVKRAYKFFTNDHSGQWLRRERDGLAAILKRLGEHDHIVDFMDVQAEGCEHPFLALEYLGGGSLEEWIVKKDGERPGLTPDEIIRQVVSGLAAAHSRGIAHRDIKPANLLLTEGKDVRVKIGDFGLAKVAAPKADGGSRMASLAGLVGTAMYLPPEAQHKGRRKETQDDVFALGVVWYQLAVGEIERPPYDFADRLRSKGVDSHSIGLIERCLAHPSRRFEDAGKIEDALEGVLPPPTPAAPGVPDVGPLAWEYVTTMAR